MREPTAWRRPIALFFLSAVLCVASAEVAARAFWRLKYGVPFWRPSRILYAYYPELRRVDAGRPGRQDAFYDVLLLGASFLHPYFGQVERELREELAHDHGNVRIFNLAQPSQTSRDSWLKYSALGEARFELVIFYDGINEARANNAPPDLFQEDYSHYFWYRIVNTLAPYHGKAVFSLPCTVHFLVGRMRDSLKEDRIVPKNGPREDWLPYGQVIRSAPSFRRNLGSIPDLAEERGDRVLLMTFATYIPDNYSREAFREKRLDYGLHRTPLELWGTRENVLAAVAAHNAIVRGLAAQHAGVLFVDQEHLMAGHATYFDDPCHFTALGSAKFVENLRPGQHAAMDAGRPRH